MESSDCLLFSHGRVAEGQWSDFPNCWLEFSDRQRCIVAPSFSEELADKESQDSEATLKILLRQSALRYIPLYIKVTLAIKSQSAHLTPATDVHTVVCDSDLQFRQSESALNVQEQLKWVNDWEKKAVS